jgi:phage baseplate assembly protein W
MAFRIPNRFTVDIDARQAVGVSIPFSSKSVFNQTFTTADQTKSNLINYLLTNKGERVLNPLYGGNLRALLFEQISTETLEGIQKRLSDDITNNFPYVNLKQLSIIPSEDTNTITIFIQYAVLNLDNEVIEINLNTNAL